MIGGSTASKTPGGGRSVALVSLGCPKNLVDSESMLARLAENGFVITSSISDADVAVVNTCSFLESAREEAGEWLHAALKLKRAGRLKAVVIAGCLPALRKELLFEDFPEIDAIVGPRDRLQIGRACVAALSAGARKKSFLECSDSLVRAVNPRAISTGRHTAYVKISEGCDNRCSYCLIPTIRGRLVSRTMNSVVKEATQLAESGVRELSLVAQDTTSYGVDLYSGPVLHALLERLCEIRGIRWIRLLYTNPAHWRKELLDICAGNSRLCKYADIPIQHVSDKMLRLMGRKISQKKLFGTLEKMRNTVPNMALRTTVMVGFPGEGEKEFSELLRFLGEFRFDHLGAFAYSREKGTRAYSLPGQVDREVKEERLAQVMELQKEICRKRNESFVGREVTVLLDRLNECGTSGTGRTEHQAPDVDSVVHVSGDGLKEGEFFKAIVVDSAEYELFARAVSAEQFGNN